MLGNVEEATMRHYIAEASASARRLKDIIDVMLVLAGVRRQHVVPVALDMASIVAESVDRLDHLLRKHSAVFHHPAAWPAAVGHAPWVTEVWLNFISNAAKYGGFAPQISVGGELGSDGCTSRFWVKDHGLGLDAAAQPEMFVPSTRISTIPAKGHGLGLSVLRRIVEKLGGKVGVESQPGAGARFWFELPSSPVGRPCTGP